MKQRRGVLERAMRLVCVLAMTIMLLPAASFAAFADEPDGGISPQADMTGSSSVTVSNLSMTPSTHLENSTVVNVKAKIDIVLTGTGQANYHDGDTVTIPVTFSDFAGSTIPGITITDSNNVVIGTLDVTPTALMVTFNAAADTNHTTNLTLNYDSAASFAIKGGTQTFSSQNKTLTIGDPLLPGSASVPYQIDPLQYKESVYVDGNGVLFVEDSSPSLNLTNGEENGSVVSGQPNFGVISYFNNSTDYITYKANPSSGEYIKKIIIKKNGVETVLYPQQPVNTSVTFTIKQSDLELGTNSVEVYFSTSETLDTGYSDDVYKEAAAIGTYEAWTKIITGQNGLQGLTINNGASLDTSKVPVGARTAAENTYNNFIVEDEIPNFGQVDKSKIEIIPRVTGLRKDLHLAGSPAGELVNLPDWEEHAGNDLIAANVFTVLDQAAGESYASFKNRIESTPLSYGVYVDPVTTTNTVLANYGSPGNPATPGPKYTDTTVGLGTFVTGDPDLNQAFGDGNCVGGKVMSFRLMVNSIDYSSMLYQDTLTNTATTSFTDGNGKTTEDTAKYPLTVGNGALAIPGAGFLTLQKVDSHNSATNIENAQFKIQIKDGDGNWVDYTNAGSVVSGSTSSAGKIDFGVMIVGEYKIVEVSAPEPYTATPVSFTSAGAGGVVNADGTFTVTAGDTKGFYVTVTDTAHYNVSYDTTTNGGSGTVTDSANPHDEGSAVTVKDGTGVTAPAGKQFDHWNTAADDTGTSYSANDVFNMPGAAVTLYAIYSVLPSVDDHPAIIKATDTTAATPGSYPSVTFSMAADTTDTATSTAVTAGNIIMPADATVSVQSAAADATGQFNDITFKAAGTYKFNITETSADGNGWTKDGKTVKATAEVTSGTSGYAVAWTYDNDDTITNTYSVTGANAALTIKKATAGATPATYPEVTFTVAEQAGNDTDGYTMPADKTASVTSASTDQTATFGNIAFSKPGEYKFDITETGTLPAGWAQDNKTVVATVTVTDTSGTLSTQVAYDNDDKITNTYTAAEGITLDTDTTALATKTVAGTNAPNKSFDFTLAAGTNATGTPASPMPATATKTVATTGANSYDIGFGSITYTAAGVYNYTITESALTPADPSWTCDTAAKNVVVTVTLDAATNTLSAEVTTAPSITNTYSAPGTSAIQANFGTKTVAGTSVPNKSFDFSVTPVDGAPAPANSTVTVATTGAGNYDIDFGTVTFPAEGTYHYTVKETSAAAAGWTMDTADKDVAVAVTKQADNSLKAEVTKVTVTNTYASPTALEFDTATEDFAVKTVVGEDAPSKSFDFEMATPATGTPAPAGGLTATVATNGAGDYAINFGKISFTEPGTYTYAFHETTTAAEDWICDSTVQNAVVTVTLDTTDNTLHATATKGTVTNTYFPNAIITSTPSIDPPVMKTITGETPETDSEFEFEFKATTAGAPMPSGSTGDTKTGTVTGAGSFEFGDIFYTAAGTYEYTIKEIDTGIENYDFDTATYKMTVEVTQAPDFATTGNYVLVRSWQKDGVATENSPEFTNIYATPNVSVTKDVDKTDVKVGEQLTYTLTVSNSGTRDSKAVYVRDYMPANTQYVSATNGGVYGAVLATGKEYVSWELPSVAAGETKTVSFTVSVNECQDGTAIDNTALWSELDTPGTIDANAEFTGTDTNKVQSIVGSAPVVAKKASLAKTGDAAPFALFGFALLAAGGVVVLMRRRREQL